MYFLIINVMIMLCLFLAKNWAHCYLNKIVDKRNGKELIRCTMDSNRSHIDKELFRFILITKLMKFNQVSVENYQWKRIMWRESKSLSGRIGRALCSVRREMMWYIRLWDENQWNSKGRT